MDLEEGPYEHSTANIADKCRKLDKKKELIKYYPLVTI